MFLGLIKIVGLPILVVKRDFIMKIFEFSLYLTIHSKRIQARTTYAFSLPPPHQKKKTLFTVGSFQNFRMIHWGLEASERKKRQKFNYSSLQMFT